MEGDEGKTKGCAESWVHVVRSAFGSNEVCKPSATVIQQNRMALSRPLWFAPRKEATNPSAEVY